LKHDQKELNLYKVYCLFQYIVEDVAKISTNKLSTFDFYNFYFTTCFNPKQGPLPVSLHFELNKLIISVQDHATIQFLSLAEVTVLEPVLKWQIAAKQCVRSVHLIFFNMVYDVNYFMTRHFHPILQMV